MNEDAPALAPDSNTMWQWVQAINALSTFAAQLRQRLDQDGRLARADDTHADLLHTARQHPPVRIMREAELAEWQQRVPPEIATQHAAGDPISVWTARMRDGDGTLTDEWGVEAHTWDSRGAPTGSAFVVCRDAADAVAVTSHLRENATPQELSRLQGLADHGAGQFMNPQPPRQPGAAATLGRHAPPLVLTEQDWAEALWQNLPPHLAERIVITDPAHQHHSAWRELHELANEEVWRIGADPVRLARLCRSVPRWHNGVRNPPALAHWAISESRGEPGYGMIVNPDSAAAEAAADSSATSAGAPHVPGDPQTPQTAAEPGPESAPRLAQVRSPREALWWAESLQPGNPLDEMEAKAGFGRWGSRVDSVLSRTYPGLAERTASGAQKAQRRADGHGRPSGAPEVDRAPSEALYTPTNPTTASSVTSPPAETTTVPPRPGGESAGVDPATLAELADQVQGWDPARRRDRLAAWALLGHSHPQIDRLIVEQFPGDTQLQDRAQRLYPDGLPEADAAAWRRRAEDEEATATAATTQPDIPSTTPREDLDGQTTARPARTVAAHHQGTAAAVAAQPSVPIQPAAGPRRR